MNLEQRAILSRACTVAEATIREINESELHSDATLAQVLAESPIQPWIVAQAKCFLVLRSRKTALLAGSTTGTGVMIARLPTHSPMLIRWSAPLFVKIQLRSFGLSFGRSVAATFALDPTTATQRVVTSAKGHTVSGLECSVLCGSSLTERPDVISANLSSRLNTVGATKLSGSIFDLSFCSGAVTVDEEKNAAVYGTATPTEILSGGKDVPPPPEFQPLYTELSLIVHGVEQTSGIGPSRVSASLERMSTGYDPDRRMVMPTGKVLEEEEEAEGGAKGL